MNPNFTVAARNSEGVLSLWRLDTAATFEDAREQITLAILAEEPFKSPSVVLVGINGGKA